MVVEVSLSGHPLVYLKKTNKKKPSQPTWSCRGFPPSPGHFGVFAPIPSPGPSPPPPPQSHFYFFSVNPRGVSSAAVTRSSAPLAVPWGRETLLWGVLPQKWLTGAALAAQADRPATFSLLTFPAYFECFLHLERSLGASRCVLKGSNPILPCAPRQRL